MDRLLFYALLACLLLFLLPECALAGPGAWLSGFANRSRVIQICIVVAAVALFVIMKKFTED